MTSLKSPDMPDLSPGLILSVALAGGVLSLIMAIIQAVCRVLSWPECSPEDKQSYEEQKANLNNKNLSNDERLQKEEQLGKHILFISEKIRNGAESFLKREYSFMLVFVIFMGIILGVVAQEWDIVLCFALGAFLSATCGYIGMAIAVRANVRTCYASTTGLNEGLQVAFSSGSVMGLGVTSSGILGLCIIYGIRGGIWQEQTRYLAGFGFGASAIALFARVGGGIYTKAADVGADLIGKVEENIPEDDPRNPATIADNVGDNVGDVAGMGADLFESFVGSIIAAIQLAPEAANFFINSKPEETPCSQAGCGNVGEEDIKALISLPLWIAGFGMVAANVGVFLVRTSGSEDPDKLQDILLHTIARAIYSTGILAAILALVACGLLFGWDSSICWKLFACNCIGLVAGMAIGQFTEYVTSFAYKPTITIAKKSRFGAAGVVIQGLGIGMLSTICPVLVIIASVLACYELASTYGIAIAAVGMLSTLGVTLATDAFGPVADNAGGIAEMAHMEESVRDTTDALDALGNTTAATGKGFAIGSAVLTALALLTAYKQDTNTVAIDVSKAEVLSACILGACLPYIFAATTMMAVGRAATMMIDEVRKQFRENNLLGKEKGPIGQPDYDSCIKISTDASLYEMIIPGVLALCAPLFVGYLLGAEALGGLLVGAISSGFMLAVYMANAGGAWDNAKKFVEAKGLEKLEEKASEPMSKGSKFHKAVVVGDTIGDPFKDTSGPALNILIKLMTMISLVFGPAEFRGKKAFESPNWWIGTIIAVVFIIGAISLTILMRKWGFGKIKKYEEVKTVELSGGIGRSV